MANCARAGSGAGLRTYDDIGDSGASCIIVCLREPIAKDIRLVEAEEDGRVPSVYLV